MQVASFYSYCPVLRNSLSEQRHMSSGLCMCSWHATPRNNGSKASYDVAVGPAVLYSDLSSNSPLEGPRVFCTAILSKTFLSESTDCRVSALSSFIFQEGCKSHPHVRPQQDSSKR